jgi:flagellar protein FliO/FliZ
MKRLQLLARATLLFPATAYAADQPGSGMAVNLFKVLLGLLAVLAMMAVSAWMLKRFGIAKAAGGSTIKIVGGVSVGNRERILVVEVADQWIVVGVAPGRVNSLATMPRQEQAELPAMASTENNFSTWLKRTIDKRNAK